MSDTTQTAEVLDLHVPDYSARSRRPRKTMYRANQRNVVTIDVSGIDAEMRDKLQLDESITEVNSYVEFSSARLIGASYREQKTNSNRDMLVVNVGIVLDGLGVGLIDEDGNRHPHPLLSEPRYARYRNLPHRVNAQQWMARDQVKRFDALANHLYDNHNFRIIEEPRNPEDSQRQTTDVAQVRPLQPIDPDNPKDYGAPVNGFEVSVNTNYAEGFRSFYEGLTEQQQRIESAFSEEDEELRAQKVQALNEARNVHFVGGAYFNKDRSQWFARVVDVGIIIVDGNTFPFYPVRGNKLDSEKLLSSERNQTGGNGQALPVGDSGPTAEELASF